MWSCLPLPLPASFSKSAVAGASTPLPECSGGWVKNPRQGSRRAGALATVKLSALWIASSSFQLTGIATVALGRALSDHGRIAVAVQRLRSQSTKILSLRRAFEATARKRDGSASARPRAMPPVKSPIWSQSCVPSSGATTCTPLPPLTRAKLLSSTASSSFFTWRAAALTSSKATPSSGSRSKMMRSTRSSRGTCAPQPWNSSTPNCAAVISPSIPSISR